MSKDNLETQPKEIQFFRRQTAAIRKWNADVKGEDLKNMKQLVTKRFYNIPLPPYLSKAVTKTKNKEDTFCFTSVRRKCAIWKWKTIV